MRTEFRLEFSDDWPGAPVALPRVRLDCCCGGGVESWERARSMRTVALRATPPVRVDSLTVEASAPAVRLTVAPTPIRRTFSTASSIRSSKGASPARAGPAQRRSGASRPLSWRPPTARPRGPQAPRPPAAPSPGYNATVLAYGQTGSGKTFTMGSGNNDAARAGGFLAAAIPCPSLRAAPAPGSFPGVAAEAPSRHASP